MWELEAVGECQVPANYSACLRTPDSTSVVPVDRTAKSNSTQPHPSRAICATAVLAGPKKEERGVGCAGLRERMERRPWREAGCRAQRSSTMRRSCRPRKRTTHTHIRTAYTALLTNPQQRWVRSQEEHALQL
eukprot:3923763-Rhodomonas_salina.2